MLRTSMAYKRLKYFHKISSLELIEKIKTSVEKREEQIIHKRRKYKWLTCEKVYSLNYNEIRIKILVFYIKLAKTQKKNENTTPWLELVKYSLSCTIAFYIEIWHYKEKCYEVKFSI